MTDTHPISACAGISPTGSERHQDLWRLVITLPALPATPADAAEKDPAARLRGR